MLDYFLYFILIYWILSIIGVPISSLLAGLELLGSHFWSWRTRFPIRCDQWSLHLLLERQFEVGDAVLINNISGTIASVGVRTTQVRGYDGTLHYIPNRNITVVSNQSRGNMRALIELPISSNVDLKSVYETIEAVHKQYAETDDALASPPNIVGPQTKPNGQFVFHHRTDDKERFTTRHLQALPHPLSRSTVAKGIGPPLHQSSHIQHSKKEGPRLLFCFLYNPLHRDAPHPYSFLSPSYGMVYNSSAL